MSIRKIAAAAAANECGESQLSRADALLRFVAPAEGHALGSQMQILVQTENGLEMRCFQY